ncbi:4-alpha-glucanotransferase [Chitinophaga sp. 212800010-3]|uniref:4-alpha-glucanotransferase n=1 Tax=unclassified Chitinophaga TaxID=2619133 RepID=UPI002DEC3D08|nr:4-alpha-glucanotransferase [Chitinophaga sp. 212800010-3]
MNYRLRFYLRYHTNYGQDLYLLGNIPVLGNDVPGKAFRMQWLNNNWWYADVQLPAGRALNFRYQYILRELEEVTYEGRVREFTFTPGQHRELIFTDTWNVADAPENTWLTAPFTNVFFKRPAVAISNLLTATHIFRIQAPLLEPHQTVCLLGNHFPGEGWNTKQPLLLEYDKEGWFSAALDLRDLPMPLEYKYGIYNQQQQLFESYETGDNRELHTTAINSRLVVLHDGMLRVPRKYWQGTGVAIPVFSLRSSEGFGTGEFLDLPELAGWARKHHFQLIQILPVNDTIQTNTWRDSYPYSAISSFALHPQYIRLQEVGVLPAQHPLQKQFNRLRQWLNEQGMVDYETMISFKLAYLRALYEGTGEQWQTPEYHQWVAANKHWLLPYAAYCYLRGKYQTNDFTQWPAYNVYDYTEIDRFLLTDQEAAAAVRFHFFVQYHLHRQLLAAVAAVHDHGIALKGDIPIGIARHSADTWMHPEYYHLDMQAGAPPDQFTTDGQNWGFPTYNWKKMAENGLEWWQLRLRHMAAYFDAFRIDHILGFFRIWQIPRDAIQGLLGYFHPAIPVSREELLSRGIPFDEDRFCNPWITDSILEDIFGNHACRMKEQLMESLPDGRYRLLPPYSSQRKIQESTLPETLKQLLYPLLADVLLIGVSVSGTTLYHPRYNLAATHSFAALDETSRNSLQALYHEYFYVRQESRWRKEAIHKLPLLKRATGMLICGEDLGMVPACVPDVMRAMGLLSLEVPRMPKAAGLTFTRVSEVPYLSVLSPGTHDMSTLKGWWKETPDLSQQYYKEELGHADSAPATATPELIREILQHHMQAPAMWKIFPIQDLLAANGYHHQRSDNEERINIPAIAAHYWRYRLMERITDYELIANS